PTIRPPRVSLDVFLASQELSSSEVLTATRNDGPGGFNVRPLARRESVWYDSSIAWDLELLTERLSSDAELFGFLGGLTDTRAHFGKALVRFLGFGNERLHLQSESDGAHARKQ